MIPVTRAVICVRYVVVMVHLEGKGCGSAQKEKEEKRKEARTPPFISSSLLTHIDGVVGSDDKIAVVVVDGVAVIVPGV